MEVTKVDIAIIGSGSAGLYAMSKVRPSGKSFVLINGGPVMVLRTFWRSTFGAPGGR